MDCTTSISRRSERHVSPKILFELCLSGLSITEYDVKFALEDNTVVSLDGSDYLVLAEADSLENLKLSVPWLFL